MSEIEKINETEDNTQQPKSTGQLKSIAFITIGLVILAGILGQVIPKLLIAPPQKIESTNNEIFIPNVSANVFARVSEEPEMPEIPTEEVKKQIADILENQEAVQKSTDDGKNSALETEIATLKEQHEKELYELKNTLTLEHSEALKKANQIALGVIAFTELKEVINKGEAYTEQINKLKKYQNNNTEIESIINELATNSSQPVVTREILNLNFAPLIKKAIISQETNAVKRFINKFITTRKVGEVAGESDEAIIARAEVRVKKNDLKAALDEISYVSPATKLIFEEWINQANNSLNVHRNLERLQLFFTPSEAELQP